MQARTRRNYLNKFVASGLAEIGATGKLGTPANALQQSQHFFHRSVNGSRSNASHDLLNSENVKCMCELQAGSVFGFVLCLNAADSLAAARKRQLQCTYGAFAGVRHGGDIFGTGLITQLVEPQVDLARAKMDT